MHRPLRWDVFCRVIDNYGDAGVCWRLAADLAARGHTVRLWIDDPAALAWMAPQGQPGVECIHWAEPLREAVPGDVVVEAFGCDPPAAFVRRMAAAEKRPLWINLEYLSAEDYVERSHGLPSPQASGPGQGLTKWFFYPGFSPRAGGLLREPALLRERAGFDRAAWLQAQGLAPGTGERVVSLFCYDNPALPALLQRLADAPTLLLLTPGAALQAEPLAAAPLRTRRLPWLAQGDYDRLLWSCDLNFVRGEDSFVRAQWAGVPFVWHIYPQHDGAHAAKLDAFLDRFLAGAPSAVAGSVAALWQAWNGLGPWPAALPPQDGWAAHCCAWRETLLAQQDLTTQLLRFASDKG